MEQAKEPESKSLFSRRTILGRSAAGVAAGVAAATGTQAVFAQDATPVSGELAANPGTVTQARVDAMLEQLPDLAQSMLAGSGIPGMAVAVVYQDQVIFTQGFGVRDITTGEPNDVDTRFQLASVSKSVASTVVSAVVGDGEITWDSRIIDLDPGFQLWDDYATTQLTIRDCFCHRSGMPDHVGDVLEDIGFEREAVLHQLRYQTPFSSFRSHYEYTNFIVTEGAVAAAASTGDSWEDLSMKRLYEPLKMTRTSSLFSDFINDPNHASLHAQVDGEWKPQVRQPDAQSPAGGVSSSITDMAQWLRLQLGDGTVDGQEIVDAAALAQTHIPHMVSNMPANPSTDRASFYGLGIGVSYDEFAKIRWSHSGAFSTGASTTFYMLPQEGFGIVALSNGQPQGIVESLAYSVLDLVQVGTIQRDYASLLGPIFAAMVAPPYGNEDNYTVPPANPTPALANDAYVGNYSNDFYGDASIEEGPDGLVFKIGPEPMEFPMRFFDRDIYLYDPTGENAGRTSSMIFTIGADGLASDVTIEYLATKSADGTLVRKTAE
jgi:CubicO group peptidase (beta-lactamase class C family)